jgi:MFS family permease
MYRYGRRLTMSVSFILMTFAGFLCTFGPQDKFGVGRSYIIFVIARFFLACSTRGISESGFVLGSEMGRSSFLFSNEF